jgi:hypothetical protein
MAGLLMLKPFDPYRFHRDWTTGVSEDQLGRDAAASRLRTILRSRDARVLWKVTPAMSLLFLVFAAGWLFVRPPQHWAIDFDQSVTGVLLWAFTALGLHLHMLMAWGLETWRKMSSTDNRTS